MEERRDKPNSLSFLLQQSYKEMDENNLDFIATRVRVNGKTLHRNYLEMSYSGEDNMREGGNNLQTAYDDELFSTLRRHGESVLRNSKLGADRNTVIIRIRVTPHLFKRLKKADLVLRIEDTIIDGRADKRIEMKHGYWSI